MVDPLTPTLSLWERETMVELPFALINIHAEIHIQRQFRQFGDARLLLLVHLPIVGRHVQEALAVVRRLK